MAFARENDSARCVDDVDSIVVIVSDHAVVAEESNRDERAGDVREEKSVARSERQVGEVEQGGVGGLHLCVVGESDDDAVGGGEGRDVGDGGDVVEAEKVSRRARVRIGGVR